MSPALPAADSAVRQYAVFISYRHADNLEMGRKWANWLHEALESYEVPPDLVGKTSLRGDKVPASLYPVFRDEVELPADADLSTSICRALENSGLLVVLCSPRAAQSPYVAQEIRHFKEMGKSDRILALMIDGEPNVSDDPAKGTVLGASTECFPEPLRFGVADRDEPKLIDWKARTEPIAADVRPGGHCVQGWTTAAAYREQLVKEGTLTTRQIGNAVIEYNERLELAKLKIIAGALGLPLGDLTQRDKAFQLAKAKQRAKVLRRWMEVVGVFAIAAIGSTWLAMTAKREVEVANVEIVEKNEKITSQNEKITSQNEANLKNLHEASMADYAVAVQRIEKDGKWSEGVAHLARSLKWEPGNQLAAMRLYSTLSLYAAEKQSWPRSVLRLKEKIVIAKFSKDGTRIVAASADNTAQVWDVASGKPIGKPLRHEDAVNTAQFSADCTRIVTASTDRTARVWDTVTGKQIGKPLRHEDEVNSAEFSMDGTRIVTTCKNKTARVWDAVSGKPIGAPMRHEHAILNAHFSADCTRIVTATGDFDDNVGEAQVWDTVSGNPVGERLLHEKSVLNAQFNADGTQIVTASEDYTARLWDAATGKPLGEPMHHENIVVSAQFSMDGTRIITLSWDNTARVWDALSGEPVGKPLRHENSVLSAEFSEDGTRIVTASEDQTARVWNATTGNQLGEPLHHDSGVKCAQFSMDSTLILTANWDSMGNKGEARGWDAAGGKPIGEPLRHGGTVWSAQFSADGTRIVTVSGDLDDDRKVRVWHVATGRPLCKLLHDENGAESAQFSTDGTRIITLSWDNTARIWDASSGKLVGELLPHEGKVKSAQFNTEGTRIVTVGSGNTVQVWDTTSGKPLGKLLSHGDEIESAQSNADGTRIVTVNSGNAVQVWDATSDTPLGEPLRNAEEVRNPRFNPDSTRIITVSSDNLVQVWDATRGNPIGEPMRHESEVRSAQFNTDGTLIVTTAGDFYGYKGEARVWRTSSSRSLGEPLRHEGNLLGSQFSPDSSHILTASTDNTVRVWDVDLLLNALPKTPEWMLRVSSAVAGLDFDADGQMKAIPAEERLTILLKPVSGDDAWANLARWLVQPAAERTITPDSKFTCRQIAERERDSGYQEGIESALRYDQTVPLAHLMLAKFEENPQRAAFLRDYELKRLPEDAELWTRAAGSLVEQKDFKRALQAAEKALVLAPSNAEALKARAAAVEGMKVP